jgi:nucleoside-diphosphate-sugar epimerase
MSEFWKDKKVVVTGGSGFIGTHYLIELVKQGAKVITHTHKSPLQYTHESIIVHENLDLTKLCNSLCGTNCSSFHSTN